MWKKLTYLHCWLLLWLAHIWCKWHYEVTLIAVDTWIYQNLKYSFAENIDNRTDVNRNVTQRGGKNESIEADKQSFINSASSRTYPDNNNTHTHTHTDNAPSLYVHLLLSDLASLSVQQYEVRGEHSPPGVDGEALSTTKTRDKGAEQGATCTWSPLLCPAIPHGSF